MLYFAVFAFGKTYSVLLFARAVQGLGSACSSVSGRFRYTSTGVDPVNGSIQKIAN